MWKKLWKLILSIFKGRPEDPVEDTPINDGPTYPPEDPVDDPVDPIPDGAGFRPKIHPHQFPQSDFYYATPELGFIPPDAVSISPRDVNKINSSSGTYFVLEPGDYGHFKLQRSGTSNDRIVITSALETTPPWERENNPRFNSFQIEGSHILVHGIEIDGEKKNDKSQIGRITHPDRSKYAENVIFDTCWVHDVNYVAFKFFGKYCAVQDCLIHDKGEFPFDQGGIGFYTIDGEDAPGNRVIGCEIYNFSDAVGVPVNPLPGGGVNGARVPGLIIDCCDFYITPDLYRPNEFGEYACAEDGVDFKTGGTLNNPAIMRNCNIWGHRPTDQECGGSGSFGTGVVLHLAASNWIIEDIVIFDVNEGFYITRESKPGAFVKNVILRNVLVADTVRAIEYEVRQGEIVKDENGNPKPNPYSGGAFRITGDVVIENSSAVGVLNEGEAVNTTKGQTLADFKPSCILNEFTEEVPYTFWIKRLSGPEAVTINIPVA